MAEALVSAVVEQLSSILLEEIQQEVCLVLGTKEDVRKLQDKLITIRNVLRDAERRQVKEEGVKGWLDRLKEKSYEIDGVLDEWSTMIQKKKIKQALKAESYGFSYDKNMVCSFLRCFSNKTTLGVCKRRNIVKKIQQLREEIDEIDRERQAYNFDIYRSGEESERFIKTSYIDVSEVCGRDHDKKELVDVLLSESSTSQGLRARSPYVISIVGFGGIGKTTLAQAAYNDDDVQGHFKKKMWVCVSDPFDEKRIAKAILESLKESSSNLAELETLLQCIREEIREKRFLLVLDDVWCEDEKRWEQLFNSLRVGAPGSRVIVTTRKEEVVKKMEATHTMKPSVLSEEDSWSLFNQIAFKERTEEKCERLKLIGEEIVKKCKGLPLAIKTAGSHMRFKKTEQEWQDVLDSEIWQAEVTEKEVFPILYLSYCDLPSAVKQCFAYCSMYSKDTLIYPDGLIAMWMAQGYLIPRQRMEMEEVGTEYFDCLVSRSFFQDISFDKNGRIEYCKMHDLVHDFAIDLVKNKIFEVDLSCVEKDEDISSYNAAHHCTIVAPSSPVQDSQFEAFFCQVKKIRSLCIEDTHFGSLSASCQLKINNLTNLRVLALTDCGIKELSKEVGKLIHLRYLGLSANYDLRELPETLCDLVNLQTLQVCECDIRALPRGIGKLVNLRHLLFSSLEMFTKLGKLRALRTLRYFIAKEGTAMSEGCKLGELKNLNNLRGKIWIQVEKVVKMDEAKEADMEKKKQLRGLIIVIGDGGRMDEDALSVFKPHANLERLRIEGYNGACFPSWVLTLTNLRWLVLQDNNTCENLPCLGRLPFLSSLQFVGMEKLKKIGRDFLGVQLLDNTVASSSSLTVFPKLEKLNFVCLPEWEEWEGVAGRPKGSEHIIIMPYLRELQISYCPKIKSMPEFLLDTSLKQFDCVHCPYLELRYKNWKRDCRFGQGFGLLFDPDDTGKPSCYNYTIRQSPQI